MTLLQKLNLHDKGSDCIIIHPGSSSLKFGLASQFEPFEVPMIIGHPKKMINDNHNQKNEEQLLL